MEVLPFQKTNQKKFHVCRLRKAPETKDLAWFDSFQMTNNKNAEANQFQCHKKKIAVNIYIA